MNVFLNTNLTNETNSAQTFCLSLSLSLCPFDSLSLCLLCPFDSFDLSQ